MWGEIIGSIAGTTLLGASYLGLYKLGWYVSRNEQTHKIQERIKDINELVELQEKMETEKIEILKEHKQELLEHLEKLKSHKIKWTKEQ
tara:strand:+ start:733 stop:999 length:267 start_codon:yes stop_codon:yes gene_type:complete